MGTEQAMHASPPSAWRVFSALLLRDLMVSRRELPYFLLRTTVQPLLFTLVFGFLLPRMSFVGRGYSSALLPGILAMSLALSSMQSVTLPMVIDFATNALEDRLLAPVSLQVVAFEKIAMGILQGVAAAVFVLPVARWVMGPIDSLTLSHGFEIVGVALLGSAAFSALGLLLGTAISPQQIGLVFSAIVAPMMFFGCVYYPWKGLDAVPVLKYLVLLNPMVYVAEGLRGSLTPALPHMNLAAVLIALVSLTAALSSLGLRSFERRSIA
jgi:ABC-2 type transport system permease protein